MSALRPWSLFLLATAPLVAQSAAPILARLDAVAPQFRTATAGITWIDHQAQINVEEKQSGTMAVKRQPGGSAQYVVRFTDPDTFTIALRENSIERYTPKNNLIDEYDIGRYRDLAQTMLVLGFGMTGRQLTAAFEISNVREESIGPQKVTHLDLAPKSAEIRKQVSRIELWISEELGCAVQQQFHYPGGSYKLVQFSDLKLNPKLAPGAMDLPKNAKRQKH